MHTVIGRSVEHTKHDAPCWTYINFENVHEEVENVHEEVVMYSTDPGRGPDHGTN
jgi:hypothetical protein